MIANIDYSLYLVTDRKLSKGRKISEIVRQAVCGGVSIVQLREKNSDTLDIIREALSIRDILRTAKIPLVINDRIDVALAVEADGIHLGQKDMPLEMARKIVGNQMFIGISVESVNDAIAAEQQGADYVSVSPVFATPTKTDTALPLGIEGVRAVRNAVKIPVVAIGGLNADNISEVIRNGADGVAVVSAIISADDPKKAALTLRQIIQKAKQP